MFTWLFGVLVHVGVLGLFLLLPNQSGFTVWETLGVPIILAYPIATMLLFSYMQIVEEDAAKSAALKASESRFALAMDATKDGIFDWNVATNAVFYSAGYAEMLGYAHKAIHGGFEFWRQLTHPDDLEQVLKVVNSSIEAGDDAFETTFRMRDTTGEWLWILARCRVTNRDENGRALRVVGTHTNITERRRQEEVLAAQLRLADYSLQHTVHELLTRFLDEAEVLTGSTVGFFHFVEDDQESLSLQAWSTNTTQNMCTALGAGFHYPISEAGVWVDCVRVKQPVVHNDYPNLSHKRGLPEGHAPVLRELVVPVIRDDKIVAILGVGNKPKDYDDREVKSIQRLADLAWEIVVRRRSEELNERLMTAIEQAAEAVVIMDPQGRVQYANPSLETLTGYTVKEMLGKLPLVLEPCSHEPDEYEELWRKINAGEAWQGRLSNVRKNGEIYTEDALICPVFDADRELTNLIAVKRDITEQLQLQVEKEWVEEQYRQAQKMEAIGTLAGGIAHDFNNILFAILGNADIAKDSLEVDSPEYECLEQITRSGQRAADLVKQILTFARKSGKRLGPYPVAGIVNEVAKLLRSTLPANITITKKLQTERSTVLADSSELHQVLLNLCTNAGQSMMERGGELTITLSEAITTGVGQDQEDLVEREYLHLSVKDTGCGIEPKLLPRIFEPFFTTKGTGGTGMGLAAVHGIINGLGGTIDVTSEIGAGTEFNIYLPLAGEEAELTSEGKSVLPGGSERILLVDDEQNLTTMLQHSLSALGYEVTVFNDSLAALASFQREPDSFDVVITDQTMPKLTGAELTQRLLEYKPDLPVILLTGYSHTLPREKASELGLAAYLNKPVPLSELATVIRGVLDNPATASASDNRTQTG